MRPSSFVVAGLVGCLAALEAAPSVLAADAKPLSLNMRKRVEILDKVLHRKDTAKLIKSHILDLLSSLFGH